MDPLAADHEDVRALVARARRRLAEDPSGADALGRAAQDAATTADGVTLALAVRGSAAVERGALPVAMRLAAALESQGAPAEDPEAAAEVAAFRAQLAYFTGAYRDALEYAGTALTAADATGDPALRLHARLRACVVLGNLEGPGWPTELHELRRLADEVGEPWPIAIAHNDLSTLALAAGELARARRELELAAAAAARVSGPSALIHALLCATRAEIELAGGAAVPAAATAAAGLRRLATMAAPNPYLLGMTVLVQVRALLAQGAGEPALEAATAGLRRLGDRTPQARALLLRELARTLRDAGRIEAAYDALEEAAELERVAFRQFTALQLDVERAVAVGMAARREAEVLRDVAERDPLTGLHNRRRLEAIAAEPEGLPLAVTAIDLDHFKVVNDRFGHEIGDRVLVRAAELLQHAARADDVVARVGGEEFLVVMREAGPEAAVRYADAIRRALADEPWAAIAVGLQVTASIGIAAGTRGLEAVQALADDRLYAAKRAGRDRVVAA